MTNVLWEDDYDTCEATGKRIFITAPKAYVNAGRLQDKNKRHGDRHAVHAYLCDDCGHWHVGHTTMAAPARKPRYVPAIDGDMAA